MTTTLKNCLRCTSPTGRLGWLALALAAFSSGCASDDASPGGSGTGGSGAVDGTGGSGGAPGGASTAGGTGGSVVTGGSSGSGGSVAAGSGGDASGGGAAGSGAGPSSGTSGEGGGGGSAGAVAGAGAGGATGGSAGSGGGSPGGAGSGGAGSGGRGGSGGGGTVFDPGEAVYSVALSVTTAGVTKTLALKNSGSSPATVSALAVSGADGARFVTEGVPAFPTTIDAGRSLDVTVRFLPPSNAQTSTFSGVLTATLTGTSSATASAGLYGLAMSTSNAEATLDQVVKTLGYAVNVGGTTLTLGTGNAAIGEEVLIRRFVKATASEPVRLEPVARYSPWEAAPYGYYTGATPDVTRQALGTMSRGPADNVTNRTLLPPVDAGAMLTFDPASEAFGIFAESQSNTASVGTDARFYQEDSLNDDQGGVLPVHRFRAYPLKNRSGQAIANSYLLACEEASNSDFQDYVFVIQNVRPAPN